MAQWIFENKKWERFGSYWPCHIFVPVLSQSIYFYLLMSSFLCLNVWSLPEGWFVLLWLVVYCQKEKGKKDI